MDALTAIPHMLYVSNWPELSYAQQKFFVLMIGNAQRSVNFHGYIINSTLESYSKVFISQDFFFALFFKDWMFCFLFSDNEVCWQLLYGI